MTKIKKKLLNSMIVSLNITTKDALKKLEMAHKKILFITNRKKLIGVIEDSDIRRALIKKKKLSGKVLDITNKNPKFIFKSSYSEAEAEKIFRKFDCIAIPIVDKNKRIVSIEFNKFSYKGNLINKFTLTAFIMAGGLGKRLRPITKTIPKPLVHYKKKPILDNIIERLISSKIQKIYISVNYKKKMIINHIKKKNYKCKIIFVNEKKTLGTAGSLSFLKNKEFDDIFVINGDLITNFDLKSFHKFYKENKLDFCAVTKLINFQIPYGLVETKNIYLKSLEEKPILVKSVLIGAYILNKNCLKLISKKKIDMPNFIQRCMKKNLNIGYYPTYEKYSHITSPLDLK